MTEYSRLRERSQEDRETERLAGGSTGAVIERNMRGLRALIDRSMAEARLETGIASQERIAVAELVEEIELDACLEASAMKVELTVAGAGTPAGDPSR